MRLHLASFSLLCLLASLTCRGDVLWLGGSRYDGTLNGIKGGKVSITIRGQERPYDLADVSELALDDFPKLADAESARAEDPKKAAALYKQLIPTINKPDVKLLVEWRAIEPLDRDAQWSEALNLFLDVYRASPTDAVWNGHPVHWPAAGSKMLDDGAARVTAAIKDAKSDDARKNLRQYLLDIYTKAGNTTEAQRVAHEIETGIAADPVADQTVRSAAADPAAAGLTEIAAAIAAKKFDAALTQADAQLPGASGETAVQLYAFKAFAFEGQNKLSLAAGTWLRIFTHYPTSPAAPGAPLDAARLEKKLNDIPAAKNLLNEIQQKYPDSKEAAMAANE